MNGSRDWAYRLREREAAGDDLTLFQRQAWREAMRTLDAARDGDAAVSIDDINAAFRVTGDLPPTELPQVEHAEEPSWA